MDFGALIDRVINVIRQPELHMREIPILIGLGILLVFILLVLAAIIFVRPAERPNNRVEEKILRRALRRSYFAIIFFGVFTIITIGLSMSYASKPTFCAGCHEMQAAYQASQASLHKRVACSACHQEPGMSGVFIEKLRLIEMLIAKTQIVGAVTSAKVANESCLRCHKGVLRGVKESQALKIKHKEPLEAGYSCTDCHYSKPVLHVSKRKLDMFGMSRCVECHNQKRASADCSVCHTLGNSTVSKERRSSYPVARIPELLSCKGCHSANNCLKCHTVQLPHAPSWNAREHAMDAFIGKKICWQCHDRRSCRKCHPASFPHGNEWVKKHGPTSRGQSATCSNCHNENFCLLCHTDSSSYNLKQQ